MGAEERQSDTALSEEQRAAAQLTGAIDAYALDVRRFNYYRLLYLLERLFPDTPRLGHTGPASEERIRLRVNCNLVFPASDVSEMDFVPFADSEKRVQLTTTFLGLYGSVSPLPSHYIEEIAHSVFQGGAQPVREFLDVFHHRLLSILYRTWAKYRQGVGYLKGGQDTFTRRLFCAVGRDGFSDHETPLNQFYLLRFAPLLTSKSRSARGLEVVLDELFGNVGAEIEQFVGHWTKIEKPLRNKLGVANHQLGESLTIGRYVFDGSGRFKIKLGPLDYDNYLSFLPGGHRRPLLQRVVNHFAPGIHDVVLELNVDLEAAPRFQLGSPRSATLQRTAWLGGTGAKQFQITVPLEVRSTDNQADDDDDYSEPPPL